MLETLFTWSTRTALVGWAVLALAPRWRWGPRALVPALAALPLGLLYVALILVAWGDGGGGFGSLEQLATLFADRRLLLAGWVHYLAFDLLVGSWQVRDAGRLAIPHLFVLPCLALTLFFGPAGLLLYLALRVGARRRPALGGVSDAAA